MSVLVCVPASRDLARQFLSNGTDARVAAFSSTPELCAEFGLAPDETEEAEFAATLLASIAALISYGERVVLAAVVDDVVPDPERLTNGGVIISGLQPSQVVAWFVDETPEVAQTAAEAVHGLSLDEAWETTEVVELLANHDLCWHDPSEAI